MKHLLPIGILGILMTLMVGCGTVGKDFDIELARSIVNGQTNQAQISEMFGEPFKKGIQNGHPVWVYEKNVFKAIGEDTSKNLIVEFDSEGVVRNHQIMSNIPRS